VAVVLQHVAVVLQHVAVVLQHVAVVLQHYSKLSLQQPVAPAAGAHS
jgi:hypothetical protein